LGGIGDDTIFGENHDDLLFGGEDGEDFLDGGEGDDELFGEAEDDTLLGGEGIDTLSGNNGDDILEGEEGDDILNGGAGADTFLFSTILGTGIDIIEDFFFDEGDRIEVLAEGFDIDTDEIDRFEFSSSSGEVSFDGETFAIIANDVDFIPSEDIDIV